MRWLVVDLDWGPLSGLCRDALRANGSALPKEKPGGGGVVVVVVGGGLALRHCFLFVASTITTTANAPHSGTATARPAPRAGRVHVCGVCLCHSLLCVNVTLPSSRIFQWAAFMFISTSLSFSENSAASS